ncbi:hypothetical protein Sinme_0283 [Sinorhizobium meliloti AK83]|nr:hypothetical protein Sinme_0283 [Sinorhizobium meliloti AK83]SEJ56291.1 hypothetical protein SAMN04244575_05045 [Sinorhizobium meliloti]
MARETLPAALELTFGNEKTPPCYEAWRTAPVLLLLRACFKLIVGIGGRWYWLDRGCR